MKFYYLFTFIFSLFLTACTHVQPNAKIAQQQASPPTLPKQSVIPYPEPNITEQINHLNLKIARLEHQVDQLQTQIHQLTNNHPRPAPITNNISIPSSSVAPPSSSDTYSHAWQQYQRGNYIATINLLRNIDNQTHIDANTSKSIYLLIQSHLHLSNCESVINIGQRYIQNTRQNHYKEAPEILYNIAQCQIRIQQRDIAKVTLKNLIQTYPNSAAAKRAIKRLNKRPFR